MAFQRILCPVDFSDCSRHATEIAFDLAARLGAAVTLLHVVEPPRELFPPPAGLMPGSEAAGDLRADALRELESWKDAARTRGDVPVTTQTVDGTPSAAILDAVRSDSSYDLVVMGSHGRGGLKRAILGSVADTVVRRAPCPVLVVPSSAP